MGPGVARQGDLACEPVAHPHAFAERGTFLTYCVNGVAGSGLARDEE